MKKIYPIIVLVFCIPLAFCGEDEKYSLIYSNSKDSEDVRKTSIVRFSQETSFTIPEIGFIKYSTKHIDTIEFLGTEGEFWKFEATLTEMESDNYVGGLKIMDQYREAMENNPCYLYVKSSGFDDLVHHIKPVKEEDAYLQDAFDAAYMNILPLNFRYPFGRNAVDVAVGDSWTASYDSAKIYINMGSPPSLASSRITWTLKRVKEKRGRKIATVEAQELLTLDMRVAVEFWGERRLLVGRATGTSEVIYKWDLGSGEILKGQRVINLSGDFEMDDKNFHMKVFQRNIGKALYD